MQDHPAPETAQEKCQASHRVWMMDVDDVIFLTMLSQPENHCRRNHRSCHLCKRTNTNHFSVLIETDDFGFFASAEHVTVHASFRYADRDVPHHLLNASTDRIELAEFQNFH